MRFLYIGQYSEGTTSKMRADQLIYILKPETSNIIDTHIPFYKTNKLFRSIGFRYKKGPLINSVNTYIQKHVAQNKYDLIWVDKGVYISKKTIRLLRERTDKLIHFTPDPAFTYHKSKLFKDSISYYDYLITTKSFELQNYYSLKKKEQIIYATQGFDKTIHRKSDVKFLEKEGLAFLGHYEVEREEVIEALLNNNVLVTLAGIKWSDFAKNHRDNHLLNYLGDGVYGEDYVKTLQKAKIAWGSISKWIPEKHTTRTFEIPACGTALLTEVNDETISFYKPSEAIFYNGVDDLVKKVTYYMSHDAELEAITNAGYIAVQDRGFDYESIMLALLKKMEVLNEETN